MKKIIPPLLLLLCLGSVQGQLSISSGAQFTLTGTTQLTLNNIDLVNNGGLIPGTGSIRFTGNGVNRITGLQNMSFYDLVISKPAGSVQLQVPVAVSHQLIFNTGLFDLNANDLNLGSTGTLVGETDAVMLWGSMAAALFSLPHSMHLLLPILPIWVCLSHHPKT